jgi:hypothetical protein
MLPAHADKVAHPLCGVDGERKGEPFFRANRIGSLELRDFGF